MSQRIKNVREKLNLTQKQLAKAIGCNQSYIALVETERCPMSNKFITKIAKKYKVNENYLLNKKARMFA